MAEADQRAILALPFLAVCLGKSRGTSVNTTEIHWLFRVAEGLSEERSSYSTGKDNLEIPQLSQGFLDGLGMGKPLLLEENL